MSSQPGFQPDRLRGPQFSIARGGVNELTGKCYYVNLGVSWTSKIVTEQMAQRSSARTLLSNLVNEFCCSISASPSSLSAGRESREAPVARHQFVPDTSPHDYPSGRHLQHFHWVGGSYPPRQAKLAPRIRFLRWRRKTICLNDSANSNIDVKRRKRAVNCLTGRQAIQLRPQSAFAAAVTMTGTMSQEKRLVSQILGH